MKIEQGLERAGLQVWLDDSEIRLGRLLDKELQDSIRNSRVLVLLWSRQAAKSRWVASEWLTAFHMNRFIVPCGLDHARPPQCLQNVVRLSIRKLGSIEIESLSRAVKEAPHGANELAPVMRGEAPELTRAIERIEHGQQAVDEQLARYKLAGAASTQRQLNIVMEGALHRWPFDPVIANLAGYHLKNGYLIKHWGEVQAGRAPDDPLLPQAEAQFFDTLALDPTDPSALNGLGNILFFRRDVEAAEFFMNAAIAEAGRRKVAYSDAEHDLALVRRFKAL
jgi:tetratricopeptide (TPR) repeat protein